MSNTFGFGGHNASVIFKKFRGLALRRFTARILHFFSPNKQLFCNWSICLGFTPKHRIALYQLALMHRSKIEELPKQ
jgi:hypothetical protein